MHRIIAKFLVFPTSFAVAVFLSIGGNADAELAPGAFTNRVDFPSGSGPISVDVADLDGDGLPDVVVSNYTGGTLSLFQNAGTGVLSKALLDNTTVRVLKDGTAVVPCVYGALMHGSQCERFEIIERFSFSTCPAKFPGCIPENLFSPKSPT